MFKFIDFICEGRNGITTYKGCNVEIKIVDGRAWARATNNLNGETYDSECWIDTKEIFQRSSRPDLEFKRKVDSLCEVIYNETIECYSKYN